MLAIGKGLLQHFKNGGLVVFAGLGKERVYATNDGMRPNAVLPKLQTALLVHITDCAKLAGYVSTAADKIG